MKLLSVNNLKPVVKLLTAAEGTVDPGVRELAAGLLKAALTSHKLGIVFLDPTCGNSGTNLNHLLLNLLKAMGKPWEDASPELRGVVVASLKACPDQVRAGAVKGGFLSATRKLQNLI